MRYSIHSESSSHWIPRWAPEPFDPLKGLGSKRFIEKNRPLNGRRAETSGKSSWQIFRHLPHKSLALIEERKWRSSFKILSLSLPTTAYIKITKTTSHGKSHHRETFTNSLPSRASKVSRSIQIHRAAGETKSPNHRESQTHLREKKASSITRADRRGDKGQSQ